MEVCCNIGSPRFKFGSVCAKLLAVLVAAVLFTASQVHSGELAPAWQIIAKYDRNFFERYGAQTFGELLDTGILRYFFTGGRNLLVMVNARPYSTTAGELDAFPLSMIERIEVLRAESLGTIGGQAAVRGAYNIVLRKDLNGYDVRTVTRSPSRDGGEALQGGAVWGGETGSGGHMTIGLDILDRQEIPGSTRVHSRSEFTTGGSFAEAKNVSLGGNTIYIFDSNESKLRSVPLGDCETELDYTGHLTNPPGITNGDKGCGFAFGNVWWDTGSSQQENAILNLDQPIGEQADLYVYAKVRQGKSAFRYAPSVGVFSFTPSSSLLESINDDIEKAYDENSGKRFTAVVGDIFAIGHRFIGHGNRDWRTSFDEYDVDTNVSGRLTDTLGYEFGINAYAADSRLTGDTFVETEIIREEIRTGRYNLANPLSENPLHKAAIEKSSLVQETDSGSKYLDARFSLEGRTKLGLNGRNASWTAGIEVGNSKAHQLLTFRANDGSTRSVNEVLGSGGISYAGERNAIGTFAELSVPLANSMNLRAAARIDDYNDVGLLRAQRLGVEYHKSEILTLRGSWSTGDSAPNFSHMYSTDDQDHPYVRCIPPSSPPPRTCTETNRRQVTRITTGNKNLKSSGSERRSIGIEIRKGPAYVITDWYWLKSLELPGQHSPTWAVLNYPECVSDTSENCINRVAGEITIRESFGNIVKTEIVGVNTRFGVHKETDWGFVATRGFWRYVSSSEITVTNEDKQRIPLPRNAVRIVTSVGRGNLTAYWALNYRDAIVNQDGGRFSAWTGHDLTLDWKKPFGIESMRLTAGVYNVTDKPLSVNPDNPSATDGPRAAGWGRTFFATLNIRF